MPSRNTFGRGITAGTGNRGCNQVVATVVRGRDVGTLRTFVAAGAIGKRSAYQDPLT